MVRAFASNIREIAVPFQCGVVRFIWKVAMDLRGPGPFHAYVYVDQLLDQINVITIGNKGRAIKSREALLSAWQDHTGTSASKLRHIEYEAILNSATVKVLESIWKDYEDKLGEEEEEYDDVDGFDYEDDTDDSIKPAMTVERPPAGEENWRYNDLLNETPFGVGAAKMCLEYTEMEKHFVESFTFGIDVHGEKWLVVNFGVQQ
ncbi:hypothetical protein LZ30DRAFT_692967 [Colletotrichum cereale]|nr:hypothetical protein LZ30DRAFT_692967 [Colletotrichum cereale]